MSMRVLIIGAALLLLIPAFVLYERRRVSAETMVLIAMLTALAVASRAAFFMVPFFKPVLAFAVIAGVAMGPMEGFMVGSLTALASNFLFGQGPWTLFQMTAWGLTGSLAGLLADRLLGGGKRIPMMIYGFCAAFFLHGLITDLWTIFFVNDHPNLATVLSIYGAGLVPNLILGVATVVFLGFIGEPLVRKIRRVRIKYGMEKGETI